MKAIKVIVAGVIISVFDVIVGALTCGGVFNWVYKLEPTNVWKPVLGAPGVDFFIGLLVMNIIFALIYALLKNGVPGNNRFVKGIVYGVCVWAVGILPGMFSTYMFMTVAVTVIVYLTVSNLILMPVKGLIVSSICS